MKNYYRILFLALSLAAVSFAQAENWAQWRGPALNGTSPETNLPEALDEKNQVWAIDLPGRGASTPIVFGDKIFLTTQGSDRKLLALCFDAKSGKELWRKEMGNAGGAKGNADWAGPSAITDGKNVFFYFSTGDLAAFDTEGNPIWPQRNLQKDHGPWRSEEHTSELQ